MFLDRNIMRKEAGWDRIFQLFLDAAAAVSNKEKDTESINTDTTNLLTGQMQKNELPELLDEKESENDNEIEADILNFGSNFTTASWEPYINFFVALFFFLFAIGVSEKAIPNSILFCGISLFFAIFCFFGLADNSDRYALIAMCLNFLSWLVILFDFFIF